MGQIIPATELEIVDIKEKIAAAIDVTKPKIAKVLGITVEELVVRDSLPKTDFGMTNEYWYNPALTANAYTEYFKQKLENKAVIFYGVTNPAADPKVTGARFYTGEARTKIVDIVHFENIYTLAETVSGYFEEPLIFINQWVVNDLYAKAAVAAGAEPVQWKAITIEKLGEITY